TRVGHLLVAQARVCDRLLHGQVGIGRRVAHEPVDLAVDQLFQIQVDRAGNLAAQAHFGIGRVEADARATFAQAGGDSGFVSAQAGNDAQTGNDDATHADTLQKLSV